MQYALRLLSQRSYSVAKLAEKLRHRQLPDSEIQAIIHKLTELHLLDDRRYAHDLAKSTIVYGQKSRWWTSQKLATKGLDRELIAAAMANDELPPEADQIDYHISTYIKRHGVPREAMAQQKLMPDWHDGAFDRDTSWCASRR